MLKLLTQADTGIVLEYLQRNELETTFLYANIREFGITNRPEIRRCADYYGFFAGGSLKGILPFYNLGSCIPHFETHEAVPYFVELMKKRSFSYLLGMRHVVAPLFREIKQTKVCREYKESSYCVNRNFRPFTLEGVTFLDVTGTPDDDIVDFVLTARVRGFQQQATRADIIKTLLQRGTEEDYLIAVKDGKKVAQACIQTYTPAVSQIGAVYTAEDERGKGYCKAIVSELCQRIMARGKMPALSVDKDNLPALKAYNALGFTHYADYLIITFA